MGFSPQQLAMLLLQKNPQIARNPQAQQMLAAIQNNDAETGRKIAENLCKTYGVSIEEATQQAEKFFGIK